MHWSKLANLFIYQVQLRYAYQENKVPHLMEGAERHKVDEGLWSWSWRQLDIWYVYMDTARQGRVEGSPRDSLDEESPPPRIGRKEGERLDLDEPGVWWSTSECEEAKERKHKVPFRILLSISCNLIGQQEVNK